MSVPVVIEVKGIVLRREGEHAVVEAWMPDGSYAEIIRERLDGNFSHCVHAGGIEEAWALGSSDPNSVKEGGR